MKKFILPVVLIALVLPAMAQKDSTKTSEKKFRFGFGLGFGMFTQSASVLNASAELQGEYKPAKGFSVYGSLAYNRLFVTGGDLGSGSAGYATLVVGPRAYLSPKFFVGIGGGIAFFAGSGASASAFDYNPHVGFDGKKVQFIFGYNGLTDEGDNLGIAQVKVVFKLGK